MEQDLDIDVWKVVYLIILYRGAKPEHHRLRREPKTSIRAEVLRRGASAPCRVELYKVVVETLQASRHADGSNVVVSRSEHLAIAL